MLPTQQPCEGYGTGTVTLFSKKEKWKPHPKLVTVWPRQPKHVSQTPSLVIFTMLGLIPADLWHKLPSYQVLLFQEHQGTEGNRRPAGSSWEVALLTLVLGPYRLGWKRRMVCHEGLLWGAQHYTSCPTVRPFLTESIAAVFDTDGGKIASSLSWVPISFVSTTGFAGLSRKPNTYLLWEVLGIKLAGKTGFYCIHLWKILIL